jgi:ankyrin repeat protein
MHNARRELQQAVADNDLSAIERLLETGGRELAAAYTDDGWTYLHLAPDARVAELLLEHGADINAANRHSVFGPGNRPLHAAVYMDRADVVALLIARGADANATDDAGWTPLHLAVANGRLEMARQLLEAGADPNVRIRDVSGKSWAGCSALELLHVWDRTGEGREPLPEDVKADLWRLLRDHGATGSTIVTEPKRRDAGELG